MIFDELGFGRKVSLLDGYEKYVHPDLEVEFLTPERGRGKNKPYSIDKLHVSAQGLRYLDLLQNNTLKTSYNGVAIIVPEPSALVLHKFIVSKRRKKQFKRGKDIETAKQLGEYLLGKKEQREKMREIYFSIPEKWRRDLLKIVKDTSEKIYSCLKDVGEEKF